VHDKGSSNEWPATAVEPDALAALMRDASRHRSVAALSRDIGHELKSVLNVVGLNLALLSRVASTGTPSRADLELAARTGDVMRRELKRLDASIEVILQTQGRDDGQQRVDLGACCERVGSLIAAKAARQRVTLDVSTADTEILVDACPAQLQNAILNLAVNALQAMPKGGRLEITASGDGERGWIRVCDSGPGLPHDVLPRVWEPHQSNGGTGVGLATTKSLVDANGGRIAYDRGAAGAGACLVLEFPRQAVR
jgi:two-component system sensor histidine kinase HydH